MYMGSGQIMVFDKKKKTSFFILYCSFSQLYIPIQNNPSFILSLTRFFRSIHKKIINTNSVKEKNNFLTLKIKRKGVLLYNSFKRKKGKGHC